MPRRLIILAVLLSASVAAALGQQPSRQGSLGSQQPARDTPAQQRDTAAKATGRIAGRVLAADTGRPVKRGRVFITAAELPEGRGVLTDDNGGFDIIDLPAGRYLMSLSTYWLLSL